MTKSKSLKKEMREEFSRILPNVLDAVMATPVNKETVIDEDVVFKKFNFRMAFATLVIVFFAVVISSSEIAYSNPNTYLTMTFSADLVNDLLANLSTNEETSNSEGVEEYTLTLGVNSFDYVVDVDADNEALKESITNLGVLNKNFANALSSIMDYAQEKGMVDLNRKEGFVSMNILTNYETRSNRMEQYVKEYFNDKGIPNNNDMFMINPGMQVPIFKEPRDVVNEFHNNNPIDRFNSYQETYGRIAVINEILKYSDKYSEEELSNMSNRDLAYILMETKKAYNVTFPRG